MLMNYDKKRKTSMIIPTNKWSVPTAGEPVETNGNQWNSFHWFPLVSTQFPLVSHDKPENVGFPLQTPNFTWCIYEVQLGTHLRPVLHIAFQTRICRYDGKILLFKSIYATDGNPWKPKAVLPRVPECSHT